MDQAAWPPRMSVPWGAGAFPPFRVTATAAATDLAGWPASTSCAFDAPAWLAPWGDGPLTAGGEPVVAAAIAFEARLPFDAPNLIQATLGWIPPDGSPSARRMLVARDDGSGFGAPSLLGAAGGWATSAALSARLSSATGRGDPWIAWTEAAAGGKAQPHVARWDGSSWVEDRPAGIGDAARVAREIVLSICAMAEADGVAAWTEVDDAGESSLATRRLVDGSWRDLQGTPGVALPVGGRGPAISTVWGWGNQTIGTPSVLLAFIEAGPAGVPQVRAAEAFPGTGWVAQAAVGNKDSGASASEPTAVWQHEAAVAWVEAGRVLVRETDLFFGGLSFGEPTVLNVDPARRARSPRAARSTPLLQAVNAPGWRAPLTIYFVEEGPGGDDLGPSAARHDVGTAPGPGEREGPRGCSWPHGGERRRGHHQVGRRVDRRPGARARSCRQSVAVRGSDPGRAAQHLLASHSPGGPRRYPRLSRLNHREASAQGLAVAGDQFQHRHSERFTRRPGEPDQDDSTASGTRDEGEPPKVLVLGEQDSPLAQGKGDDLRIHGTGRLFGERPDVMACGPEDTNDREVEILVGQEVQGDRLPRVRQHDHVVGNRVCGVAQHRVDVVAGEARVRIEEVALRGTLGELAKDPLYRDACAANDGLALKDGGVELNSIGGHGRDSAES